jgi:hypothetical protein
VSASGTGSDPWVAVLLPVWRRPHRIEPLLDNLLPTIVGGLGEVWLVHSLDDEPTTEAILARLERCEPLDDLVRVLTCAWPGGAPGDYARKINLAAQASSTPWVFTGADDLHFRPGWVEAAIGDDPEARKINGAVIGTNDLFNPRVLAGQHSTHSFVARWYVDGKGGAWGEPGSVFHEGYPHEFCDDELIGVAKARGQFRWVGESIVEHLHPYAGKSPRDDVYEHGHRHNRQAELLFLRRSRGWTRRSRKVLRRR